MAEHQKIVELGPQLRVAFQDHLGALSELLLARSMISEDNRAEVTNTAHSAPDRASSLLRLVRNRVKLESRNYYIFVDALKTDLGTYKSILQILGETTGPSVDPNQQTVPPSLQRCVGADALQKHFANLNLAIIDPEVFGANMVQCGLATQTTVAGIVGTLGFSNYQKANKLLQLIDSQLKTTTSRELAMANFDKLVLIVANVLNRVDIADSLVASYKAKDPTYRSPLQQETDLHVPISTNSSSAAVQPEAKSKMKFSESMSTDDFKKFLIDEGLSKEDCQNIIGNGIGAKAFATDLKENDIDNPQLEITFMGKKILKRLLSEVK